MSGRIKAIALLPVARALGPRLNGLGIDAAALADPARPVSLRVADCLWAAAGYERALAVAAATEPRTYGHLTYLIAASATVGEALRCLVAYYGLLSDGVVFSLEPGRRVASLTMTLRDRELRPDTAELFMIATVIEFLRRFGTDGQPREIVLSQADPGPRQAARLSAHLGASLSFGHPAAGLRFSMRQLGASMRQAEPGLAHLLEAHARAELVDMPSSTTARVRAALEPYPDAPVAAVEIAKQLGMSARTLRRQLQAEGSSVRALLDDARRTAVQRLLARPEASLTEAAATLGYSDVASFGRAFRRWFGMAPAAYRGTVALSQISAMAVCPGTTFTSTHDS